MTSKSTTSDVRVVVFCHDHADGDAFDPDPVETDARDVELRTKAPRTGSFAAVGWRQAGLRAAALAAARASDVDRLILCCVPIQEELAFDPAAISAKTLLLYGQHDPDAPARAARWWKDRIAGARVEMIPRTGSDLIVPFWGRVLSHAAPHTLR
jgi:pimeloyl-ACP methyl ester carboxylesterase